ncbi:MAG: hypothetical protein KatS3mg115_2460 [Candidatus Poribacteria bacterium]|nr:MAG: hypothetical protein KatS3mg115_2460 [Candidatus Poribacteria bacterium]
MPYTLILNLGARAGADWLSGKVLDVFGDHFAQVADRIASEQCAPRREDPRLLGYFTDNELRWGPDWRSPKTLLADYWEMPPEAAGRLAVREFLQEHYGTVERFNAEWGTKYTSFEEIFAAETLEAISPNVARAQGAIRWRRAVQWVPRERRLERAREWFGTVEGLNREFGTQFRSLEEAVADESPDPYERALRELADAFTLRVAEQYFRVCAEAIRRHDPNHLILGCRFAGYAPRSVLVGMKKLGGRSLIQQL